MGLKIIQVLELLSYGTLKVKELKIQLKVYGRKDYYFFLFHYLFHQRLLVFYFKPLGQLEACCGGGGEQGSRLPFPHSSGSHLL